MQVCLISLQSLHYSSTYHSLLLRPYQVNRNTSVKLPEPEFNDPNYMTTWDVPSPVAKISLLCTCCPFLRDKSLWECYWAVTFSSLLKRLVRLSPTPFALTPLPTIVQSMDTNIEREHWFSEIDSRKKDHWKGTIEKQSLKFDVKCSFLWMGENLPSTKGKKHQPAWRKPLGMDFLTIPKHSEMPLFECVFLL